jgi:transposase-like protein
MCNNLYFDEEQFRDQVSKVLTNVGNLQSFGTKSFDTFFCNLSNFHSRQCPNCGSDEIVGHGAYKNRKRFRCKTCKKTFNDLTNTPFSGIHHIDKIPIYLNEMMSGQSIRNSAATTEISPSTSFIWRHKFLNIFKEAKSPNMHISRELVEYILPVSFKGQHPLPHTSKTTSIVFEFDKSGKFDSDTSAFDLSIKNPIYTRLKKQNSIHLITDKPLSLNCKIENRNITYSKRKNSQDSNSHFVILVWKSWLKRFHGVSTTYLPNYLHWFDFLENSINQDNQIELLISLIYKSKLKFNP